MLRDCIPCIAKHFTFGGLSSPLHFAAAKGHLEVVALLLGNGADVKSRKYCGQVTRADYLSGRTALPFAAVKCIRLILADYVPSAPFESLGAQTNCESNDGSNTNNKHEQSALYKFTNTALHMAALNGSYTTPS